MRPVFQWAAPLAADPVFGTPLAAFPVFGTHLADPPVFGIPLAAFPLPATLPPSSTDERLQSFEVMSKGREIRSAKRIYPHPLQRQSWLPPLGTCAHGLRTTPPPPPHPPKPHNRRCLLSGLMCGSAGGAVNRQILGINGRYWAY
jgi:hypothetical protein